VIVFGETGAGKSSVINMLAGTVVADTPRNAIGCTCENKCYPVSIHGNTFDLWDTVSTRGRKGKFRPKLPSPTCTT
jgi:predicted GTPase